MAVQNAQMAAKAEPIKSNPTMIAFDDD